MSNKKNTHNKNNIEIISNSEDKSKISADILTENFETLAKAKGGIPKLRETILQLAVQGKLVSQNPEDEPASVLLKKIQAEKERLLKEGKIKKQKPLPPVDLEDVPYEIPEGWVWTRLGEATNYNGTKKVAPSDLKENYWLLELEDIEKKSSKIIQRFKCKERGAKSTKSAFNKGNVLYGKLRPYLDKVVVADTDGYCTTEIVPIVLYYGIIPEYLRLFLKSPKFIEYVNSKTYGVKMPRLGTTDAINSYFPLPPLAEQHRIVKRVDTLMKLCDELEARQNTESETRRMLLLSSLNCLLDAKDAAGADAAREILKSNFDNLFDDKESIAEMRKAILQLAVQGRLAEQNPEDEPAAVLLKKIQAEKTRLVKEGKIKKQKPLPPVSPEEVPYELPEGWVWTRLVEVFDVRDGTHDTPKYQFSGIPLITSKNISNGSLSFDNVKYISIEDHEEISKRSSVERNDILFAMIGSIGNPIIVDTDEQFSIKNVALFKYYSKELSSPKYLLNYLIQSSENMKIISSGAVQSFVSLKFLREYVFPLPPLAEQHRIVERVDTLMKLCDELEERVLAKENAAERLLLSVCDGICG